MAKVYTQASSTGSGLGSGISSVGITAPAIAGGASEDLTLSVSSAGLIGGIAATSECVVRAYTSQASRAADTRTATQQPASLISGLITDHEFVTPNLSDELGPCAAYVNLEDPTVNEIYLRVFNTDLLTTITPTITFMIKEL